METVNEYLSLQDSGTKVPTGLENKPRTTTRGRGLITETCEKVSCYLDTRHPFVFCTEALVSRNLARLSVVVPFTSPPHSLLLSISCNPPFASSLSAPIHGSGPSLHPPTNFLFTNTAGTEVALCRDRISDRTASPSARPSKLTSVNATPCDSRPFLTWRQNGHPRVENTTTSAEATVVSSSEAIGDGDDASESVA